MFERSEPILRIACIALAAVLVFLVVRVVVRHNPVGRMSIPDLPTFVASTNAPAEGKGTNVSSTAAGAKSGTNSVTNVAAAKTGTNGLVSVIAGTKDTNSPTARVVKKVETNSATVVENELKGTNSVVAAHEGKSDTNVPVNQGFGKMNTNLSTNAIVGGTTNRIGTNATPDQAMAKGRTNSMAGQVKSGRMGPGFGPGQMAGSKLPDLPPLMQARIDKITQSEIMAQLTKPQPMSLVGIAGNGAMLRTTSGQSGFVKEGDKLGGVKLVRVGVNRVLVEEENGEQKELTIFSGMGSESLLPKTKEATNETISKTP